jgi:hypothetical protein
VNENGNQTLQLGPVLPASGNQLNQNLTQPKIHTRNKGKFLHKTDQIGSNNRTERKPCHMPPTAAVHNQQRKITAQEKLTWLTDQGLGQETEFWCWKKINKQAMKITEFSMPNEPG